MRRIRIKVARQDGRDQVETYAYVPFIGSPLAVSRACSSDGFSKTEWNVTHVATGLKIGVGYFRKRVAAMAMLEKLNPKADCWTKATGKATDPATRECYDLALVAVGGDE